MTRLRKSFKFECVFVNLNALSIKIRGKTYNNDVDNSFLVCYKDL